MRKYNAKLVVKLVYFK
ncbi:hypothetical protein [Escherichia ruysiae]